MLLSDPQTSDGLLLSVAPEAIAEVLESLKREGCHWATVIGECIPIDNAMSEVEVEMQRC